MEKATNPTPLKDTWCVLQEFVREFKATGTACPSSPWASRALAGPMAGKRGPMNILEVGPGTGPVTSVILERMIPGDNFTVCEINPRFMDILKDKLKTNSYFIEHKDSVSFFQGPVQDLPEDMHYDLIVCAIPFLNLDAETLHEIFTKLLNISSENGIMTYFEYMGLRKLGKLLPWQGNKQRVSEVEEYIKNEYIPRKVGNRKVWLNFLPINVFTLDLAANSDTIEDTGTHHTANGSLHQSSQ